MPRFFLLALCLLLPQVAFAKAAPQAAPLPPKKLSGQVVYAQGRDVWCINPGTRQTHLLYKNLFYPPGAPLGDDSFGASLEFNAGDMAWSPDRTQIAFASYKPESGGSELYVMRWDGTEKHAISHEEYHSIIHKPKWSPDGKKVLATVEAPWHMGGPMDEYEDLAVYTLNGPTFSSRQLHTADGERLPGAFRAPCWSRDSQQIVFVLGGDLDGIILDAPKVLSLNDLKVSDFKNNWSDFVIPNISRDGKERIEPTVEYPSVWQLINNADNTKLSFLWGDTSAIGVKPERFWGGDKPNEWIFNGPWNRAFVDANGDFSTAYSYDIWYFVPSPGHTDYVERPLVLRRLVTNARMIDWL